MEMVTISKEEYDRLLEREHLLNCLEAFGVDKWEHYIDAFEMSEESND